MRAEILRTGERFMVPLILLYSLSLLVSGHHAPGGGFAGGLTAASALVLRTVTRRPHHRGAPGGKAARALIACGLSLAVVLTAVPMARGQPVFTSWTTGLSIPPEVHLNSAFFFEIAIYCLACGAAMIAVPTMLRKP